MIMNPKIYKIFGIFLIALTLIIIAFALFSQITNTGALSRGYGQFDYLYDVAVEGILFSFIVLILGFFPGLFYYRFGNEKNNPSKLVKFALILKFISAVIMIIIGSIIFFSCIDGCDGLGEGILFVTFGVPALIIYCIGILLLIIHKFQNKNFKLRTPEKVVSLILLIMILIVGIIYAIALYEENSRSLEKCDNKQNPKDRDVCHYFFSSERPDLAVCEKIRDTYSDGIWWRDQCYIRKAQYFKDSSYCEIIQGGEQFKENCLEVAS